MENAWPPLAPVAAPHGGVPHDSFEWTEEYTDQDLNTVRLRVEASVTQGELHGGPQDDGATIRAHDIITTGHASDVGDVQDDKDQAE